MQRKGFLGKRRFADRHAPVRKKLQPGACNPFQTRLIEVAFDSSAGGGSNNSR
jgi:hypothetical protein